MNTTLPSEAPSGSDMLYDAVQLALRAGDTQAALAAMLTLLRGVNNTPAVKSLLAELVESARWELQCGADPRVVYVFLSGIYKRMGDSEAIRDAARMLGLYEDMERSGVNIRDMEACRLYIEQQNWETNASGGNEEQRAAFESSIGYWRQLRLLSALDPLLDLFPGASWLTVGDGRHAIEARYITAHGSKGTPSDVVDTVLKKTEQAGLITNYRAEFVEKLSLPDNSYDFVEAKDMLHHSSRPWQGLYEMLRVAREGICFIEPFDYSYQHSVFDPSLRPGGISEGIKTWHGFEPGVGNYVYSFSDREVAKFCMGMGLPLLACKGYCDFYHPDLDGQEAAPGSKALSVVENDILHREESAKQGEEQYELVAYIILKRPPSQQLLARLRADGFSLVDLPRNTALESAFLSNKSFAGQE